MIKKIQKTLINKIRNSNSGGFLQNKKYGHSDNIKDYSDDEISEMYKGIYKDQKMLLVDGDYFINLDEVIEIIGLLENVSYYTPPTKTTLKTNSYNSIKNIRTFYIKDYYLLTDNEFGGTTKHKITHFLHKIGAVKQGRGKFRGLYSIRNDYNYFQQFEQGLFPKDLYHPIKKYINYLFYKDDYHISNFKVETNIKIENSCENY